MLQKLLVSRLGGLLEGVMEDVGEFLGLVGGGAFSIGGVGDDGGLVRVLEGELVN